MSAPPLPEPLSPAPELLELEDEALDDEPSSTVVTGTVVENADESELGA